MVLKVARMGKQRQPDLEFKFPHKRLVSRKKGVRRPGFTGVKFSPSDVGPIRHLRGGHALQMSWWMYVAIAQPNLSTSSKLTGHLPPRRSLHSWVHDSTCTFRPKQAASKLDSRKVTYFSMAYLFSTERQATFSSRNTFHAVKKKLGVLAQHKVRMGRSGHLASRVWSASKVTAPGQESPQAFAFPGSFAPKFI